MKNEIWKPVKGYEGLYEVSDLGRVRNINFRNTGKTLYRKLQTNNDGYKYFRITVNGETKHFFVHRLVYETFVGEIPLNLQVNHIDENKENNALSNLNLLTQKDNNNWGTRNKRISESKLEKHPKARKIAQYTINGEFVKYYPSSRRADLDGFDHTKIILVCKGVYKQHKGFIWKYA